MRLVPMCFLIALLAGCDGRSGKLAEGMKVPASEESVAARPLQTFRGSFRESFSHSEKLEIAHNPHGGATTVAFGCMNKPVGFMHVRETPPMRSLEDFAEVSKEALKKRLRVDEVEYRQVTNSKGNTYLRFEAKVPGEVIDKATYSEGSAGGVALMALFFDGQSGGTDGQKVVRGMFGTFQFEFKMLNSDVAVFSPEIETVLDTFELPETGEVKEGE